MNATRDAKITRLIALGRSNRSIAVEAKCSHQNIDQIRARLRRAKPLLACVKLTDAERAQARARLREVCGLLP